MNQRSLNNTPLIILDRDGVINQDSLHYIKSPEEFIPLPGSCEAIARLTLAGVRVAVATNQSGIARGYYSEAQLLAIHEKMKACVEAVGGSIDFVVYCPHMPDAGCGCRKPQTGMLLTIAKHFGCSLENVPFIGDRVSDVQAAEAAGANPLIVLSPMTDRSSLVDYPHVPVFNTLMDCVDEWLGMRCFM
jgi:D-glycero-D-manno-heptose 1,7-bisphosphate phosphatase